MMRRWLIVAICAGTAALAAAATGRDTEEVLDQSRRARLDAWRSRMAAPQPGPGQRSLMEMINQIESVNVPPARRPQDQAQTTTQPADAAPDTTTQPTTQPARTGVDALADVDAASLADPLALGDELYDAGHVALARRFYAAALDRNLGRLDQAWAVFQLANCTRHEDPATALGLYARLLSEHPDSAWCSAATARQELLKFKQEHGAQLAPAETTTMPAASEAAKAQ
jgi:hypothetical protein